jgi:GH3 auxin-responsive promoter
MRRNLRQSLANQASRSRDRFLASLQGEQARATQEAFLAQSVSANRETSFGRKHGFDSVRSMDDYRAAVPIRHYPELAPWINRSAAGEGTVLTVEEPVRFWKTTGTTSEPKKIPVTSSSASRTMESFLALQGTQLSYYPEVNERNDTTLVTHVSPKKVKEFLGPRKIPYCSTTEIPVIVRPGREAFQAPWMAGLQSVVEDDAVRLYYLLCYASAHDLKCVACLHPSRFQTVVSTLAESAPRIIEELQNGTVLGASCRDPLPEKAKRLSTILRNTGTLRPKDLWPNLSFITSWSGSYIERYRALMEENFCSSFLAMPSISSEAFTTMTVDDHPIHQPINLRGALFEFIPSEVKVEPDTPTLPFFELVEGATYELVLTTLGGLYRYATCDIFKVGGFLDEVPRLEYIGRRSVSDLTGEKLAEEHVVDAVGAAMAGCGIQEPTYTVCGVQASNPHERPKYVLVVEFQGADEVCAQLARDLDQRFKTINSRYELKRNFGDLHPLEVQPVAPGTFSQHRRQRIESGTPAGQLKDKILHPAGRAVLTELLSLNSAGV